MQAILSHRRGNSTEPTAIQLRGQHSQIWCNFLNMTGHVTHHVNLTFGMLQTATQAYIRAQSDMSVSTHSMGYIRVQPDMSNS